MIDESKHCTYAITIESMYACPTECGFGSGGKMCGGHGICRYDTDAGTHALSGPNKAPNDKKGVAKCFCNAGHAGAGCSEAPAGAVATYGPVLGLLIFVTIVMVGLVAGIFFLYRCVL